MSTTTLSIQNEDTAWEYIQTALDGKFDSDVVELDFDNWPLFRINIKGDRYDSTMTTSLMKSLVELQGHLNRIYAEVVHHKTAKSLKTEEREALEIVFKVEKGSSNIVADMSGFFTEMGKSAMEKMTGRQVITLVVGVAALFVGGGAYKHYLDSNQKTQEEANKHQITMALLQQNSDLLKIQGGNEAVYTNILKSVSDAEKVTLDKAEFSREQLSEISRTERQSTELTRVDGNYFVSSLKVKPDRYKIEIVRLDDENVIATDLFKGHLSIDEMERIARAFMKETPIQLNVVARVRGDSVTTATIVGVDNLAKGAELTDVPEKTSRSSLRDLDLSDIDLGGGYPSATKRHSGPDNDQG